MISMIFQSDKAFPCSPHTHGMNMVTYISTQLMAALIVNQEGVPLNALALTAVQGAQSLIKELNKLKIGEPT